MVSLALAWGLDELGNMGVSNKIAWGMAFLFAFLPINILSTVTLFKDIPYSVAILILSVILLKVINSQGNWFTGKWCWFGIGINCLDRSL